MLDDWMIDDIGNDGIISAEVDAYDDYASGVSHSIYNGNFEDNNGVINGEVCLVSEDAPFAGVLEHEHHQPQPKRAEKAIDFEALDSASKPKQEQANSSQSGATIPPAPTNSLVLEKSTQLPPDFTGYVGKIGAHQNNTPAKKPKEKIQIDHDLKRMAFDNHIFSLQVADDDKVPVPKVSEVVAQFYRTMNVMIDKISLNRMIKDDLVCYGLWDEENVDQTASVSDSQFFNFDRLYYHSLHTNIINQLRRNYNEKTLQANDMDSYAVMGAGKGISSAAQAAQYIERMSNIAISTTISYLCYQRHKKTIQNRIESMVVAHRDNVTVDTDVHIIAHEYQKLLKAIGDAVSRSSKKQANSYIGQGEKRDDIDTNDAHDAASGVFVRQDHHCVIYAKRHINSHSNIQLPNSHLRISALNFFFSGLSFNNISLSEIGFHRLAECLHQSSAVQDSLVRLSLRSHRHCYPIGDLSAF